MSELAPLPQFFWPGITGAAGNGYQLYTYAAGTTTPLATYTDETGLTPNTNPVVLNSSGFASVWIGNNSYKFILYDNNNNLIWSQDNIQSLATQLALFGVPIYQSVNISYTQLQTASTSNAIQLFALPSRTLLSHVVIKSSTAFTGGSISDLTIQVGPSGNYGQLIDNFSIFQAVADQTFANVGTEYIGSFSGTTPIYINATSVGANLSALTQGSLTAYYSYTPF